MSQDLQEFSTFAEKIGLLERLPRGGNFPSVIPRILGKGKTRAEGLVEEKPPAMIERLFEYGKLDLKALAAVVNYPIMEEALVVAEQHRAKEHIEALQKELERPGAGWELTAREVMWKLGDKASGREGRYSKDDIELIFDKKTCSWSWRLAGVYPLVSKLPHDVEYLLAGYSDAKKRAAEAIVEKRDFLAALRLAWAISKEKASSDSVLIRDLAGAYVVAIQGKEFWERPSKATFVDKSDAAFVLNLVHSIDEVRKYFELDKAGLHETQLAGKEKNVSYELPKRGGNGTEPYATIRLKQTGKGI